MPTILQTILFVERYMKRHGMVNVRRDAEDLVAAALGWPRIDLYLGHERIIECEELERCRQFVERRAKREPLAYIEQTKEFYGCNLFVGPGVLIPRQETELLVDLIAKYLEMEPFLEEKQLWDVCCGSGCIAIALKKKFPRLKIIASDISSEALDIAKRNAKQNSVSIEFRQGDLLAPYGEEKADFVVCNPPYISERELWELDADVRDYEPRIALVSGPSGLEFYERLAVELKKNLHRKGCVWLEVGYTQGYKVKSIFMQAGWTKSFLTQDLSKYDRFFSLENE